MEPAIRPMCVLGTFMLIVGCLLLATLWSTFLPPYTFARNFQSTSCKVQSSQFFGNVCCTDLDCQLQHPCLQIKVAYAKDTGDEAKSTVYKDFHTVVYQKAYTGAINVSVDLFCDHYLLK